MIGMKNRVLRAIGSTLLLGLALSACQSTGDVAAAASPPKPDIPFIDLQGFDRELSVALADPLPKVNVPFYDRIVPSALPDRLQNWMAAVEAGGGTVKVTPPKPTITPKDPLLLFSIASAIWKATGMAQEMSTKAQFRAAQSFDAEMILKVDDKGDTVVDRVVFTQRKK
jgi:hypothetical protein